MDYFHLNKDELGQPHLKTTTFISLEEYPIDRISTINLHGNNFDPSNYVS